MGQSRLFKLYDEDRMKRESGDTSERPIEEYLKAMVEDFAEKSEIENATITIHKGNATVVLH